MKCPTPHCEFTRDPWAEMAKSSSGPFRLTGNLAHHTWQRELNEEANGQTRGRSQNWICLLRVLEADAGWIGELTSTRPCQPQNRMIATTVVRYFDIPIDPETF